MEVHRRPSYKMPEHYKLDKEEVDRVFQAFDFYGTQQLDVRFLSDALGPPPGLGYQVTSPVVQHLVRKYDDDENQCLKQVLRKATIRFQIHI